MKLLVMKFGGASVSSTKHFKNVASIIKSRVPLYDGIVVVVSAMGKMTDHLIRLAYEVHPSPPQRENDMLISVGERVSVSLLAMSLEREGVRAISFTGSQSGIITTSEHCSAKILDVKPTRVLDHLRSKKVVIVAGFQGVSLEKEITTLGRGGSDTSAVALGVALDAVKVEFFKDVGAIFNEDPHINPHAEPFSELNYDQALSLNQVAKPVLHPRCILLAKKNNLPLSVLSFKNSLQPGTLITDNLLKKQDTKFFEQDHVNV